MTTHRLDSGQAPTFQPESWELAKSAAGANELFVGDTLAEIADQRDDIVVVTADLMFSNKTVSFRDRHPDRFINVGIAEQNMVSVSAGLATTGLIPYCATFASFMALTACEQIRTDCAYTKQKVRMLAHHAGISMGFYGTSHHATEDLSILRAMPNMTIICPADGNATDSAVRATVDLDGPIYFRLGRGKSDRVYDTLPEFRLGKSNLLQDGHDLTVIANGILVGPAWQAAQDLAKEGVSIRVLDMQAIKPFDDEAVLAAARETGGILTVEEHNIIGGVGSCVADVLADNGVATKFRRHGIRDEYVLVGPPLALYAHYGLDRPGIAKRIREVLGEG